MIGISFTNKKALNLLGTRLRIELLPMAGKPR